MGVCVLTKDFLEKQILKKLSLKQIKVFLVLLSILANGWIAVEMPKVVGHVLWGAGTPPHRQGVPGDAGQAQQQGLLVSHLWQVNILFIL